METVINSIMSRLSELTLQSSLLIAVVLLLRGAFGDRLDRRLRYYLWLPVTLRLLLPFTVGSRLSVMNLFTKAAPVAVTETAAPTAAVVILDEAAQSVRHTAAQPFPWATVLLCVWFAGAAAVMLLELLGYIRFNKRLRHSRKEINLPVLQELCVQLDIRRVPRAYITNGAASPCAVGVLSPSIYLPQWALSDSEQLRYILMHELTHIKRRDNLFSLMLSVCCAVYWFDPLVWLMDASARRDRELACDAWVTAHMTGDERTAYGMALISAVRMQSGRGQRVCAPAFAARKNDMLVRLRSIGRGRKSAKWLTVLVCALMICSLAAFGTSASAVTAEIPGADGGTLAVQTASENGPRVMVFADTLADNELAARLLEALTPHECWTEYEIDMLELLSNGSNGSNGMYYYITSTDRACAGGKPSGQIYEVVIENDEAYVFYSQKPYCSASRKCMRMCDAGFSEFTDIIGEVNEYLNYESSRESRAIR